ncbi:MAG: hypothetical protein RR270_08000, partial [Alistipes sp.]
WVNQSKTESIALGAPMGAWQYVKLLSAIDCRYIRMQYNNAPGSGSNSKFIGSNEFNAIAPNN